MTEKKNLAEKKKRGRKSEYRIEYADQALKLCLLGATDKELSEFFSVSEQTLNKWKKDYPEFLESLKKGKNIADANVASRLYNRAIGYNCKATKFATSNGKITVNRIHGIFLLAGTPCARFLFFDAHGSGLYFFFYVIYAVYDRRYDDSSSERVDD